jgi:YD repeat-containing protein
MKHWWPIALLLGVVFFTSVQAQSFGRTPGQFRVSPIGGAQYTIPLFSPPGIQAIRPNLALVYDSHLTNGLMGPGWALAGLSVISRCNLTYAQDSVPAPVSLTAADGLCLDDNRLRTTGTGTYQTEIANFSQVTAQGTAGNGPSWFKVQGKNGLTYEYGNTTDSKILPSGSTATPYIWALNKVYDRYGNYMTFTYAQLGGAYVPLSIQYAATSGSTTFPYQINFVYSTKSANDMIARSITGNSVNQTKQLSTITITSSGTTVREYKLLYTTSATTARATLTSIQECGGSAGSDCLPATSIAYQQPAPGATNPTTPSGSGATSGLVYSLDINGDGRKDLVFATSVTGGSFHWYVQFASGPGYGAPVDTTIVTGPTDPILFDDFLGKGNISILVPISGTWTMYSWNASSSSFVSTPTTLQLDSNRQPSIPAGTYDYATADVNGDGLPDLVAVLADGNIYTRLNTGGGSTLSFAAPTLFSVGGVSRTMHILGNNQFPASSIQHVNISGDGRDGILYAGVLPSFTSVFKILVYGASGLTPAYQSSGNFLSAIPINYNDDACTDLVLNGNGILIAGCNGSYPSFATTPANATVVWALNWYGTGRSDLLSSVANGPLSVSAALGNSLGPTVATGIPNPSILVVTDQAGDGLNELAYPNPSAGNALYYGAHNGGSVAPDLASSFTDGYNLKISPTYISIAQGSYTEFAPGGTAVYPYKNYIGPLFVVNSATFTDPTNLPSGTYQQTFSYTSAWMNLQGRGFPGFNSYQRHDSRNNLWETFGYNLKFPNMGNPAFYQSSQDQAATTQIEISWVNQVSTVLDATPNNQRYMLYNNTAVTQLNEVQIGGSMNGVLISTAVTNYTYDNWGNPTNIATTVTDKDSTSPYFDETWTTTTAHTIAQDTTNWCLNLPTQTTVTNSSTAPGGAAITRTVAYTPDYVHCRIIEKVIEPSSALYKVTEDYFYDTNTGNLLEDRVTGIGMPVRRTNFSWNSTAQFPATITNPLLTQSITLGFDPNTGLITRQTDPNFTATNQLQTTWGYDNFGRRVSEARLDGTSTTWSYSNCATSSGCVNSNNKMTILQDLKNIDGTVQTISNIYLDALDRPLVSSGLMTNGSYDQREVKYDSLGNVLMQGAPCTFTLNASCTTYWATNFYDILNRLTKVQSPKSAADNTVESTLISYAGRTTTTNDPLGHNTVKITTPVGTLGRSQDHNGYYQDFTYDAFGSLTKVIDNASPSNTLFTAGYAYGIEAFQTSATDADLGPKSSSYDALGELLAYTDAKGQNFSFLYDALSRPTSRTEPDLTTTWTWGNTPASFNVGQLQSVSSTDSIGTYSETYGYDSKTRFSTETIVIPGDATYVYTGTYSSTTGLLDTLTYPVSTASFKLKLQYGYTHGILSQISDFTSGAAYWTANTMNPLGQYVQETLGNGVIVTHDFDALRGWPNTIKAGLGGGTSLQNNGYFFDAVGNLTERQDNNSPGLTENFYYDSLYRFTNSTLNGVADESRTYDVTGNVKSWAVFGATVNNVDYSTPQSGCTYYANSQPHAYRMSTQGSFTGSACYDANGNTTSALGSSTTWTSYNQPIFIDSGFGPTTNFYYNANHQRYKQIATTNGTIETSIYVGPLLEKVSNSSGTFYRQYIPAGNNTVLSTLVASTGAN